MELDSKTIRIDAIKTRGGPAGARTRDPRIKSPMLYQLSYRPYAPQFSECAAAILPS